MKLYPNYTQKHVITYTYSTEVIPGTRNVKYQPVLKLFYGLVIFSLVDMLVA